jgi:hypothetical protein
MALVGIRLERTRWAGELLFPCIMMLVFVPAVAIMLPVAVSQGMSRAWPVETKAVATSSMLIPILFVVGFGVLYLTRTGRAWQAISIASLSVVVALYFVKSMTLPGLDEAATARGRKVTCISPGTTRSIRYGLNYYAGTAVPDCR